MTTEHDTPAADPERRGLHLGISISNAWTGGTAWRRPDSRAEDLYTAALYLDIARKAEAAKLDFVFRADGVYLDRERLERHPGGLLDPVPLLAAISSVTTRIGLVGTASTSFDEPYNLARAFGTLDLLSGGRAGWNIVTSQVGERNYGQSEVAEHEERYARAQEFVDVARALWSSWPREAIVLDREHGRYADPSAVHPIDHDGRFFRVEGPLTNPSSPQDRPALFQAGASDRGRDFAARNADAIFAAAADFDVAHDLYHDVKARAIRFGRAADDIKVLPGAHIYLGETEDAARALYREIREDDDIAEGFDRLNRVFGIDFQQFELDAVVPPEAIPEIDSLRTSRTHAELLRRLLVDQALTLRAVLRDHVVVGASHWRIVGSPEQVADEIQGRFQRRVTDGNVFIPGAYPETFDLFFTQVVPILQARGLFRSEYEAPTLRARLAE